MKRIIEIKYKLKELANNKNKKLQLFKNELHYNKNDGKKKIYCIKINCNSINCFKYIYIYDAKTHRSYDLRMFR